MYIIAVCSVAAKSCLTLQPHGTAALQASLPFIISWSFLRFRSIELVMLSNHFSLCQSLLLLPLMFPIIRIFSSKSSLLIRWPKYWSFSFSISPSNEYSGLISFRFDSKGLSRVFSSTTVQKHQFFGTQLSLWSNSHICTRLLENHSLTYAGFCQQSDASAF